MRNITRPFFMFVFIALVASVLLFSVFHSATLAQIIKALAPVPADEETGETVLARTAFLDEEIIERFDESFRYTGEILQQHDYAGSGVTTDFYGFGFGELFGTVEIVSIESPERISHLFKEYYSSETDPAALPGEYVFMGSSVGIADVNSAIVGIEADPGQSGYIRRSAAEGVDAKGDYVKYVSYSETSGGAMNKTTDIGLTESTVSVDGESKLEEIYIVERGGPRTGWWNFGWEPREEEIEEQ